MSNSPSTQGAGPGFSERSTYSTDFNAVDAVYLFHTQIYIVLEKLRVSIVFELQKKLKVNADFKGEGNKIQYSFNEERLRNLDTLANNITFGDIKGTLLLVDTEKKAPKHRSKLLKITDKGANHIYFTQMQRICTCILSRKNNFM